VLESVAAPWSMGDASYQALVHEHANLASTSEENTKWRGKEKMD